MEFQHTSRKLGFPILRHSGLFSVLLVISFALFGWAQTFPVVTGKYFDHVFIIVMENQGIDNTLNDPNYKAIREMGTLLRNHHAITHPSQPNYIAMSSGDFYGENTNEALYLDKKHIGDLMDNKGVSWVTYQENYPGNCYTGLRTNDYVRKHNPFISYKNIYGNLSRCNERILNADALHDHLNSSNIPNFMFYTPSMLNDGHDTGLAYSGKFLKKFVDDTFHKFPNRTLFVITFDEDENYLSSNRVLTLLIGGGIKENTESRHCYSHYSLLRLIEDNWNLGTLGRNDKTAVPIDLGGSGGPPVGSCLSYYPPMSIGLLTLVVLAFVLIIIGNIVGVIICKKKKKFCFAEKNVGEEEMKVALAPTDA